MLFKLIGIATFGVLLVKGTDIGAKQFEYVTNIAKVTLTQHEVDSIAKIIYTDIIISNETLPYESDEWWAAYIRKNMESTVTTRDTSKDMWLTPYEVREVSEVPGKGRPGYVVRSSGPDKNPSSEDDITAMRAYR